MMRDEVVPGRQRIEQHRQRIALGVSALAIVASIGGWNPTAPVAVSIAAAAAAVGMPHGAIDVHIGPRAFQRVPFFPIYGGLVAATAALWMIAPLLSLVAFLALSLGHFALSDAAQHRNLGPMQYAIGFATAGIAVGLPLVVAADVVTPVFSDLLIGREPLAVSTVAAIGLLIAAPAAVAAYFGVRAARRAGDSSTVAEIAAIVLVAALVHPLVSFAIYFACWHSPRHMLQLDVDARAWRSAASATLATFAAGGVIWLAAEPSVAHSVRVVFIGLAALTVPHLIVTEAVSPSRRRVHYRPRSPRSIACPLDTVGRGAATVLNRTPPFKGLS